MNPETSVQTSRSCPRLAVILPCFNEEVALPSTIKILLGKLDELAVSGSCARDSYLVFVDDGSVDKTWEVIRNAVACTGGRVLGIRLAINAGHQYALIAGIDHVAERCDVSITIDADLQDDLAAMDKMLEAYEAGAEIVLGVKSSRTGVDPLFKRLTARSFYKLMRFLGVDLVEQHADHRLMSRSAMRNLARFPEYHLFLRGLVKRLHGRIAYVSYVIQPRSAGETKYSLRKMLSLAWNGVTSFSIAPLRLIAFMGGLIFIIASGLALHALLAAFDGVAVPGWASITVPLYMLGGFILLSLGVVGEYIGKIFIEVKRRPRYLVDCVERVDEEVAEFRSAKFDEYTGDYQAVLKKARTDV
jgi:glycosyltransferase involved in cell wall biosynthesis